MSKIDYKELGLKIGIEVHQQIYTEKKMFCHCPAGRYSKEFDTEIVRHMRPTLSELGEYDGTALMEFKTRKNVHYLINSKSSCTYEMDDTPPFPVNQDGLDIAIEMALMLNCQIVDEFHIIRKQYLDGSIPAGFQRTGIVGVEGWVIVDGKKIGIIQLGYEEDSCREVRDEGHDIYFLTDRLSIPLIEIVTHPDIRTPEEAGRVLWLLHKLTRSTGKVRRGIGGTRQDVNVSIEGGTRVEIKGVPQIWRVVKAIHFEAIRQKALLEIRDELHARGVTEAKFKSHTEDAGKIFADTANPHIRRALDGGERVKAVRLDGFAGIIGRPTAPGAAFEREFAGRVRVIACLDGKPNLFHSDAWPEYDGGEAELSAVKKILGAQLPDAVFVTWGNEADANTAIEEINIRAREAARGVINETRQIMPDCTTDFERILPGPDRMYPDTDSPPCEIERRRVERIDAAKPAPPWERLEKYEKLGLPKQIAGEMLISPYAGAFRAAVEDIGVPARLAAQALICTMRGLRRKGFLKGVIDDAALAEMFKAVKKRNLYREGIPAALKALAAGEKPVYESLKKGDLAKTVKAEIDGSDFAYFTSKNDDEKKVRFYVGCAMKKVIGRAAGSDVLAAVRKALKD